MFSGEMTPVVVPGTGDFKQRRAVFNPTVRMDPGSGTLHMFARGVKLGEKSSGIIHIAGPREGPFSFVGEPKLAVHTDNEDPGLTRERLDHSPEDPRFLEGNCITLVGLDKPAYTPVGQLAKTYLGTVDELQRIVVTKLLTPRTLPGLDDRHVLPVHNDDGSTTIFSRPQRESEADYVDYFSGGPSSVYVARTPDVTERPGNRLLFGPQEAWEARRIGGLGPLPVMTSKGLFGFYMGIDREGVYRVGAVLIDPTTLTVIARTPEPLLEPTPRLDELYSVARYGFGHGSGVVFASGMLVNEEEGTIDLYCGYNDLGVVHVRLGVAEVFSRLDAVRAPYE
jgi:predicted GH43/DUF377 family glycosyl hydrolase